MQESFQTSLHAEHHDHSDGRWQLETIDGQSDECLHRNSGIINFMWKMSKIGRNRLKIVIIDRFLSGNYLKIDAIGLKIVVSYRFLGGKLQI